MSEDSARTRPGPPPDRGPFPEIPGYQILGRVGVGAMGTVYRAQQVAMDRTVALKVLFESLAGDRDFVSRFLREARSAAKLNHQNIVQAYDVGCMGNTYYLAMEFVDGESVGQVLDREKRLEEGRALAIARSVALALDHAWQNGIVHRDVKPDNILLTRTGKAKLADLGLARSVERRDRLTALGTGIGTPDYMSPEQIRGEADLDIRSDIYSLGATLYNMLTGCAPYDGPTAMAVGAQHCTEPPPDPRAKAPGVSDAAADLVLWMMAKKPSLRPQTPEELLGAIDAAFPGLAAPRPGSSTLPIPHRGRGTPEVARGNRWLIPALAALAALLAIALGAVLLLNRAPRDQSKRPPEFPEAARLSEAIAARDRAEAALAKAQAALDRETTAKKRAEEALAKAIQALDDPKAALKQATEAYKRAEEARSKAETERDTALKDLREAKANAETLQAAKKQAELNLAAAEKARDEARTQADKESAARKRAEDDRRRAEDKLAVASQALADADATVKTMGAARARAENEAERLRALMKAEAPGRRQPKVYTEWPFDAAEAKRRQEETARELGVKAVEEDVNLGGAVTLTLVLIPAGEFTIGSPRDEAQRDSDEDQKKVTIAKPFWMGKHEVTQEQWEAVMGNNPSSSKGAKNPVEQVSWNDIQGFLQKLNAGPAGTGYALPTEAQWEYACRAGTTTPFHLGETISTDQANYDGNYTYGQGRKGEYRRRPIAVGSFPANAWGLHDMHGNVWEWCASPYAKEYDGSESKGADAEGGSRVLRGGSWFVNPTNCRSAYRGRGEPDLRGSNVGFRVVRSARTF